MSFYKCMVCGETFHARNKARYHVCEEHNVIWKNTNRFKNKSVKRKGLMCYVSKEGV